MTQYCIFGAGPVGLTLSILIMEKDPHSKITIIEKF